MGENTQTKTFQVGGLTTFSGYQWRVLEIYEDKILLLCDTTIEKRKYHSVSGATNWAECALREYLNGTFFHELTHKEEISIAETEIITNNNPWYETGKGGITNDRIFLLSIEEVVKYFGDSGELKKKGEHWICDQHNSVRIARDANGKVSRWWLRSPGFGNYHVAYVNGDGRLCIEGCYPAVVLCGVRPALWLNVAAR